MQPWLDNLAHLLGAPQALILFLLLVLAAMMVGSTVRLVQARWRPRAQMAEAWQSLGTWWVLLLVMGTAVILGPVAVAILLGLVSLLALREFLRLIPPRPPRVVRWLAYGIVPIHYLWIVLGWTEPFTLFVPTVALLLMTWMQMPASPTPSGFTQRSGATALAIMACVYWLSFPACLVATGEQTGPAGPVGWFVYLVVLTECNDIAQALWGRALGRRRITPVLSPGKTWAGLVGGVLTTAVLAVLLAPLLTPLAQPARALPQPAAALALFPFQWAVLAGLLIGLAGFLGDLTLSAVKRDAGVKDSGRVLPGQGGMLDRVDSLIATGPVFFLFVRGLGLG